MRASFSNTFYKSSRATLSGNFTLKPAPVIPSRSCEESAVFNVRVDSLSGKSLGFRSPDHPIAMHCALGATTRLLASERLLDASSGRISRKAEFGTLRAGAAGVDRFNTRSIYVHHECARDGIERNYHSVPVLS